MENTENQSPSERRSASAPIDIPSYPTAMDLVRAQAGRIFLELEDKTSTEVAYMYGLDRYLKSVKGMQTTINKAYNLVLQNPEAYGIDMQKAGLIQGIVQSRTILKRSPDTIRELQEAEKIDINSLVMKGRDMAVKLVKKRLDYLDTHPKALQEESIVNLAKVMGILFDKGQILQGQATEHIAVMSAIDPKISPDEALKAILAMREESMGQ